MAPDGQCWVMQDAGTEVIKDLVLDTCLSGGYIKFLRDDVACAWQAVGFDNSANYIP